jgi:Zinc-binding dehydrogenase
MCTGHHAAVSGEVKQGDVVGVVGDGAVGLCAVLASKRLGAERIIALSRNPARQRLAKAFGATDILPQRGDEAIQRVLEMTDGLGVNAALECVGTGESMTTAFGIARVGSVVGAIGSPHDVEVPIDRVIFSNIGLRGGVSPVRRYIPELMPDVLEGRINPGEVFDHETDLDGVVDAYKAMDDRRAIKSCSASALSDRTHERRLGRALLERKPGALDVARPLQAWELPGCFHLLRRRLETDLSHQGTREFIKVLRLLERASVRELAGALEVALSIGATCSAAIMSAQACQLPESTTMCRSGCVAGPWRQGSAGLEVSRRRRYRRRPNGKGEVENRTRRYGLDSGCDWPSPNLTENQSPIR